MKICAIICEYNPFHNGHLYQLNAARTLSRADAIVCIMSGNFTQRGEAALLDKYARARHALQAGADAVLELPAVFATSNAELFAKGAVKLLSSVPAVKTLCFGAEQAEKTAFQRAAALLNDEPQEVSESIKALSATGISYAKARAEAWKDRIPSALLSSPNNILGLEYAKAISFFGSDMQILPVQRKGGGHADEELKEDFSSASAIRRALAAGERADGNVPAYVAADLFPDAPKTLENRLEILEKYAVLSRSAQKLANVCDCTEGLENALKKVAETNSSFSSLVSARYTASRIRRIALQVLLHIDKTLIAESMQAPLYLRVLGAKKDRRDVLSALSESPFPLLLRAHDENALTGIGKRCYRTDIFAEKVYGFLSPRAHTEKNIFM